MDSFQQNNPPNNNNNNSNNNNNNENNPKKGKGRRKTPTKKIENETNRHATFSRRRSGLFKKGSELNTLCGADVSIIVFSPRNKVHSFGSPNVEAVARRFRNQIIHGITSPNQSSASQNNQITHQRNQDLTTMESHLVELKKNKKETDKVKREYQPNPEDFSTEELKEMMEFMLNFKNTHEDESSKGYEGSSSTRPLNYPTAQFEKGSSSNANAVFQNSSQTFFMDPLDPTGNNFGYPYPNPNEATGSNLIIPYNYGIPTDFVPGDDDGTGTDEEEGEEE